MRTIKGLIEKYGDDLVIDYVDNHVPRDNHRLYFVRYKEDIIISWARLTLKTIDDILQKMGIEEVVTERPEEKYFIPKLEEKYWFASAAGGVDYFIRAYEGHKGNIIKHSRVFRTKEEAESEAVRQRVLLQMERDFLDNSDELDWEDDHQKKFRLQYNYRNERIYIEYNSFVKENGLYTTNKGWLERYMRDNEENILKHYFEVKEKAEWKLKQ